MSTPVITPIPPYDMGLYPLPQVTPFTFRDGASFLERFERLCYYINNTVLPTINSQVNDLGQEFITEVNALIQSVNDAITGDQALVDSKIADLTTYVNDQVASIIGSSVSVQDPVMQGIINNVASLSRLALDALYAPLATFNTDHNTINTGRLSDTTLKGQFARKIAADAKYDFGAVGDGVTDDTTALQNFVNYIVNNGVLGLIPSGNYLISAPINFSLKPGWAITTPGRYATTITQNTDNTKIFILGSDTASSCHSWAIEGLSFTYSNVQPSTNTNAIPISFEQEVYGGKLSNLSFVRGSYAMKVKAGIGCPWGCDWDRMVFGNDLSIGAIDFSQGVNGVPNNSFGRMLFTCGSAIGPVVRLRGYNGSIGVWEFINCLQGPQLIEFASGSQFMVDAVKIENGVYPANNTLINILGSSRVTLGQFSLTGNAMTVTGAATVLNCIQLSAGGPGGYLNMDSLRVAPLPLSGGAKLVGIVAQNAGVVEIGYVDLQNGAQLLNQGSNTTGETLTVRAHVAGKMTANQGDADYVATIGGPNIIYVSGTPFTTTRNFDLPNVNDSLFNGLYYEFIFYGVINGTNIANIRCNGTVLKNQSADKTVLRYVYRRSSSNPQGGWVLVKYETLP